VYNARWFCFHKIEKKDPYGIESESLDEKILTKYMSHKKYKILKLIPGLFFHNLDVVTDLLYIFTVPTYNTTIGVLNILFMFPPIIVIAITVRTDRKRFNKKGIIDFFMKYTSYRMIWAVQEGYGMLLSEYTAYTSFYIIGEDAP